MIAYGFKKFHQNENRFFHSNQLLNQRTPPHIPLIYIFKSKLIFSQLGSTKLFKSTLFSYSQINVSNTLNT